MSQQRSARPLHPWIHQTPLLRNPAVSLTIGTRRWKEPAAAQCQSTHKQRPRPAQIWAFDTRSQTDRDGIREGKNKANRWIFALPLVTRLWSFFYFHIFIIKKSKTQQGKKMFARLMYERSISLLLQYQTKKKFVDA